jgi:ATP-dependent DNA helicase PIF1
MESVETRQGAPRPRAFASGCAPPSTLEEWASAPWAASIRRALHLIRSAEEPVLLTGPAGTGKSHFLALYRAEANVRTVVLASTGIAALQVEGQTVHSFFRLPLRVLTPGDLRLGDRAPLYAAIEALIIDEVSMLRADVIDAIDRVLRRARGRDVPFGGVRVLFVGDPYQLAPVVEAQEARALASLGYASPWFFDAHVFREMPLRVAVLDRIHRQVDAAFAQLLSRVREGALTESDRAILNRRVSARSTLVAASAIVLTATRASAAHANDSRLAALRECATDYCGVVEGTFPEKNLPVPRNLILKPGARVMFVRNDPDRRWANGTTGSVIECEDSAALIRTDHDPEVVHRVLPTVWERLRYSYDRGANRTAVEVAGRYTQMPCLLGWAATVHKCQGMTLDRVRVDLVAGAFAGGQAYVALSRARTYAGLELARPLRPADVWADGEVVKFMARTAAARSDNDAA